MLKLKVDPGFGLQDAFCQSCDENVVMTCKFYLLGCFGTTIVKIEFVLLVPVLVPDCFVVLPLDSLPEIIV